MKYFICILSIVWAFGGFAQQKFDHDHLQVDYQILSKYKNLCLYPIKANQAFLKHTRHLQFTPLKEALESKKVVITELEAQPEEETNTTNRANRAREEVIVQEIQQEQIIQAQPEQPNSTSSNRLNRRQEEEIVQEIQQEQIVQVQIQRQTRGAVNTLFIQNTSRDTVYIMAGEIVQGGKQDRVIAQDMILPPNSDKIQLPVYCVEHGRWSYKDGQNFDGYYGVSSMKLRGVVEKNKSQQAVWDEVDRSNKQNKVHSNTDAYTEQGKSRDFMKEKKEYLNFFKDRFRNESDVVGVLVITGNQVVGCDLFASAKLFQTQYASLLSSYIHEAITDGSPVTVSKNKVDSYLDRLLSDTQQQEKFIEEKGKSFELNKRKIHISTY